MIIGRNNFWPSGDVRSEEGAGIRRDLTDNEGGAPKGRARDPA